MIKIFNRRNVNRLQRIVLSIKDSKPLEFNVRSNPNLEVYNQPINK